MKRKWFELVGDDDDNLLTSVDRVILSDDAEVVDFRDAVKDKCPNALANVDAADLRVFANRAAFEAKEKLEEDSRIESLGGTKKDALIVQVELRKRGSEPSRRVGVLTYADGINPTSAHFNRDHILTRMAEWITGDGGRNRYLLLNSPAASGKTSLLNLFQHKYPDLNARYVSFKRAMSPWEILQLHGLDMVQEHCDFEDVIFMIDDAQFHYGDAFFWAALIKDVPGMVSPGVRFIISATHVVSTQEQSSPAVFSDLETITRDDLLLSDEQSLLFLSMDEPLGLSVNMQQFSELKKTIIEHCNGLIGALCKSVSFYADRFRLHVPTEVECLQAFYSKNLLETMGRCFGTVDQPRLGRQAHDALLKCVLGERINSELSMDESLSRALASFAKAGILRDIMSSLLFWQSGSSRTGIFHIAPTRIRRLCVNSS